MITLPQLRSILEHVAFPATKAEIVETARRLDESDEAIARLQTLPEYRYGSVDTVLDALRHLA